MTALAKQLAAMSKAQRTEECTILGDLKVSCVVHSVASLERVQEALRAADDDKESLSLILEQFLDPETGKPALSVELVREIATIPEISELFEKFAEVNGVTRTVEDAEKN
jgi:hypothetical protein